MITKEQLLTSGYIEDVLRPKPSGVMVGHFYTPNIKGGYVTIYNNDGFSGHEVRVLLPDITSTQEVYFKGIESIKQLEDKITWILTGSKDHLL